jgi:hypothetical protein
MKQKVYFLKNKIENKNDSIRIQIILQERNYLLI